MERVCAKLTALVAFLLVVLSLANAIDITSTQCKLGNDEVNVGGIEKRCCPSVLHTLAPFSEVEQIRIMQFANIAYGLTADLLPDGVDVKKDLLINSTTHFVVVDHCLQALIVSCRGTVDMGDAFADLSISAIPFVEGSGAYVHKGFLERMQFVMNQVNTTIIEHLTSFTHYRLIFTGHSLGAAAAALFTLYYNHPSVSPLKEAGLTVITTGYGYATPGAIFYDPLNSFSSYEHLFYSFTFHDDLVSRCTIPTLGDALLQCENAEEHNNQYSWISSYGLSSYSVRSFVLTLSTCSRAETKSLTKPGIWQYSNSLSQPFRPCSSSDSEVDKLEVSPTMLSDHSIINYFHVYNVQTSAPIPDYNVSFTGCPFDVKANYPYPETCGVIQKTLNFSLSHVFDWFTGKHHTTLRQERAENQTTITLRNVKVVGFMHNFLGVTFDPLPNGIWCAFVDYYAAAAVSEHLERFGVVPDDHTYSHMFRFPPQSIHDTSFVPIDAEVSQASGTLAAINSNGVVKVWKDLFSTYPSAGRTFVVTHIQGTPRAITISHEYYSIIISDSQNKITQISLETDTIVGEFSGVNTPGKLFVSDSNTLHILDQNRLYMMKNAPVNHNDVVTASMNLNKNILIDDIDGRGEHIFLLSGGKVYIYHEMRKHLEDTKIFSDSFDSISSHPSGKVIALCNSTSSYTNLFYNNLADHQVTASLSPALKLSVKT